MSARSASKNRIYRILFWTAICWLQPSISAIFSAEYWAISFAKARASFWKRGNDRLTYLFIRRHIRARISHVISEESRRTSSDRWHCSPSAKDPPVPSARICVCYFWYASTYPSPSKIIRRYWRLKVHFALRSRERAKTSCGIGDVEHGHVVIICLIWRSNHRNWSTLSLPIRLSALVLLEVLTLTVQISMLRPRTTSSTFSSTSWLCWRTQDVLL